MTLLKNKIEEIDADKIKSVFIELLDSYLNPAFGAMSKRDFDILLFMKLQKLAVIDKNPEIYGLVSSLRVTRSKARVLLYESKLRQSTAEDLKEELKEILINPIFLKDNDKIGIEIGNPFLIDYLRDKLKGLGYITDSSFSPELVKLSVDAFVALFESYLPTESKSALMNTLIEVGAKADTSFNGVFKSVLKKLGTKLADKAGEGLAESIGDFLNPIITNSLDGAKSLFENIFKNEEIVGTTIQNDTMTA